VKVLRIILYRGGDKPRTTWLDADPGGGHAAALERLLGFPVARLPLHYGVELCCDRDGLLHWPRARPSHLGSASGLVAAARVHAPL
jgi:hypothetical protein